MLTELVAISFYLYNFCKFSLVREIVLYRVNLTISLSRVVLCCVVLCCVMLCYVMLLTLFITVKTNTRLNLEPSDKTEIEI